MCFSLLSCKREVPFDESIIRKAELQEAVFIDCLTSRSEVRKLLASATFVLENVK